MAGVSAIAFAAYGAIALAQGQEGLGAFAFSVAGAAAAFLWFNAYPAQVFMGDTGALALSVGLVVVAFMTGWWLLLPVIGIVFVMEGASDVLQIGHYKLKGTRILRRAPIHYHFQLGGWPETVVVARFWLWASSAPCGCRVGGDGMSYQLSAISYRLAPGLCFSNAGR